MHHQFVVQWRASDRPARRLSFAKCEFYGPGNSSIGPATHKLLAGLCLQPSAWDKQPGRWKLSAAI